MFANIPVLVQPYCLANVKPNTESGAWSEKAIEFITLTTEKVCQIDTSNIDEPNNKIIPCRIHIFTKDKEVATALIRKKHALEDNRQNI